MDAFITIRRLAARIPILLVMGAIASAHLVSCTVSPAAECASDDECAAGQQCVTGGGILVTDGVCVDDNGNHGSTDAGEDDACDDASPTNACGGCSALSGEPGEACGDDGVWQCDGEEDVQCVEGGSSEIYVSPTQLFLQAPPAGLAEEHVRVRNIGSGPLTIEDIYLTEGEGNYSISFFDELDVDGHLPTYDDDMEEAPDILEPDSEFYIRVRFTPEDAEASFGTIRIDSDDPFQQTVDVELLGNTDDACLEVVNSSDGAIDFGAGSTNTANYRAVTLRNCSLQQNLELHDISISDSDEGAFSIDDDDLPGQLPADSTLLAAQEVTTVLVAFSPQEASEDYEGELFVESTDGIDPARYVSLTGTGVDSNCPVAEVAGAVGTDSPDNPVIATAQDEVTLTAEGSYDPDDDALTYEWSLIDRPGGSLAEVTPSNVEQPQITVDIVGIYIIELKVFDESGLSNCEPAFLQISASPTEDIYIELTWESPPVEAAGGIDPNIQRGTDLDLHYVRPGGHWGDSQDSVYWQHSAQDWGDGTAEMILDSLWGDTPEMIVHEDPETGGHEVGVHFYHDRCWGPADATVRIYFDGILYEEREGRLDETDNFWHVGTIDWQGNPQSSSFEVIDEFTETHSLTSSLDINPDTDC